MKRAKVLSALFAGICAVGAAQGAQIEWFVSPGVDDVEVSTFGDQVFGYYFNPDAARPDVAEVNGVAFLRHGSATAPQGLNFNASYDNPEGIDLYQVAPNGANAGLETILDSQNWGGAQPLTLTELTPGAPYQVQFMISDDRPGFRNLRNYDVSDSNDPEGSRDFENAYHSTAGLGLPGGAPPTAVEAKIFTGDFIADPSGTQDIFNILFEGTNHTGANSGSQVNAIQLRLVPEPGTIGLLAVAGISMLGIRRRSR